MADRIRVRVQSTLLDWRFATSFCVAFGHGRRETRSGIAKMPFPLGSPREFDPMSRNTLPYKMLHSMSVVAAGGCKPPADSGKATWLMADSCWLMADRFLKMNRLDAAVKFATFVQPTLFEVQSLGPKVES